MTMRILDLNYTATKKPAQAWRRTGRIWGRLFLLSPELASFGVRGFPPGSQQTQGRLEHIGVTFILGFNRALGASGPDELQESIEAVDPAQRGFAVEGAAMGCAIADAVLLGGCRLQDWMQCTAQEYTYLSHVGAGWALARTPWRRRAILRHLDPIHNWLVYDGLGFHDGYFHPRRIASGWRRLSTGYAARAYDQGVGRATWFSSGGDVSRAAVAIAQFDAARSNDLWAGLGLALSYAGGASATELQLAREAAAQARPALSQGAAFAAEARARAGHVPPWTHEAVHVLAGLDVEDAVKLVRQARAALPATMIQTLPHYEVWRLRVQQALACEGDAS